jgi:hypothetical protein
MNMPVDSIEIFVERLNVAHEEKKQAMDAARNRR